jgi:flagellar basal-body rod protein FlgG
MNGAFYIGATGLDAQQRALDVIANNISNINTTGFKRSSVQFSELMSASLSPTDGPRGTAALSGVVMEGAPKVWSQGDMRRTGQTFDLAIDGNGFIELLGPAGRTMLWRGGVLKVNADGYLASSDGLPLHAMIAVPSDAKALKIDGDGTVSVSIEGQQGDQVLGKIDVVTVSDTGALDEAGSGYFELSDPSLLSSQPAGEAGAGIFVQGSLEGANVQLSDEMIQLLLIQRAYAANAQVVQAGDQLMSINNGLRR